MVFPFGISRGLRIEIIFLTTANIAWRKSFSKDLSVRMGLDRPQF
jgi:hypothetical protein